MTIDPAKIALSAKEQQLLMNPDWILTKQQVMEKVKWLMAAAAADMQQWLALNAHGLPVEVASSTPKISRGENYQGLPYVMLDFPRVFGHNDIFAVRTFFWWGHQVSVQLMVKGNYQEKYAPMLLQQYSNLAIGGFEVHTTGNAWVHEVGGEATQPVSAFDLPAFGAWLQQHPYIKIGRQCSLVEWTHLPAFINSTFTALLQPLCQV